MTLCCLGPRKLKAKRFLLCFGSIPVVHRGKPHASLLSAHLPCTPAAWRLASTPADGPHGLAPLSVLQGHILTLSPSGPTLVPMNQNLHFNNISRRLVGTSFQDALPKPALGLSDPPGFPTPLPIMTSDFISGPLNVGLCMVQ